MKTVTYFQPREILIENSLTLYVAFFVIYQKNYLVQKIEILIKVLLTGKLQVELKIQNYGGKSKFLL